ncbi:hypothetical protein GOV10_01690 [Candidatus Woesearchaeota archaeon]|nr:hypothetical protein [Candidatus Woesearchaeota archaeon]
MVVVGLTGQKCAGKGEIVEVLKRHGWGHISLSGIVAEELDKEGIEHSRENLIRRANEMRAKEGPGVLAQRAKERIEQAGGGRWVVESIRHPDEVSILKEFPDFELWKITSSAEERFARSQARGRKENADTLEKFKELEEKENKKSGDVQRISDCEALAEITITNDDTIESLQKKINEIL